MDSHQSRTMTESYQWYLNNVIKHLPENETIKDDEFAMPPFFRDSPEMRKQVARVYNSIKLTDNKIRQLLTRLEKDHLKDSTIIFFFADHGEGIPRGKTNGINLGYRVPFIVWFPEMYKHLSPWGTGGTVTDELIDFEDLASTMISLAGGEVPDYLNGRVLIGENRSKPTEYLILSSDRSDNGIENVRSVTNGKYMYSRNFMTYLPEVRYIRYMEIGEIKQQMRKDLQENNLNPLQKSLFEDRPAEYLFDIENDVWETVNHADNPTYKTILNKMRKVLKDEILRSRDILFLPEYEISLISETTTPYDYRQNNKNYPVAKIYESASLSGYRGKEITSKQIGLLNSSNKIIRYWAIIGLNCQTPETLKPYATEIIKAINDDFPPVSITASAIAYQEFKVEQAENNLKKYCASENPHLALMAISYLVYLSNKQPFVETVRSVHSMKGRIYDVKAACLDFLGSMGLVPNNSDYPE
jgi:hypothetical protein